MPLVTIAVHRGSQARYSSGSGLRKLEAPATYARFVRVRASKSIMAQSYLPLDIGAELPKGWFGEKECKHER